MSKLAVILMTSVMSLSVGGANHLEPLGENGIYIYEGAEQFVDGLRSDGASVEVMQIIYPSFEPMSVLLISQYYESEDYFISIATKKGGEPKSHSIAVDSTLAERLLEAFDIVLSDTKVRTDNQLDGTDGTIYVFYSYPYAGYRWNTGEGDKPAYLIELCKILASYVNQAKPLKDSIEIDRLLNTLKTEHNQMQKKEADKKAIF